MARPCMGKHRRKGLSITVRPDTKELAARCRNSSKFFESSVDLCLDIRRILKEGKPNKLAAIKELVEFWERHLERSRLLSPEVKSLES